MARFVHCGDIHLGFRQYRNEERYIDFATAFRYLTSYAQEENVDFVLVTGDLFDKKTIDAGTLIQAKEVLEPLKSAGIPVVVIEGNHDRKHMRDIRSWLDFLNYDGYIILLTPAHRDEEKKLILREWKKDEKDGSGNHVIIGDTIIFGLGYPGSSAGALIKEYAELFENNNELFRDKNSILMLHGGLEGYLDKMGGAIDYNELLPLQEHINYVALGHIHLMYVREDWLFNPGSLETWSVSEVGKKRGFFDVEMVDGHIDYWFIDGERWRRPFHTSTVSFTDINSYEEALRHLERELCRDYGKIPGSVPRPPGENKETWSTELSGQGGPAATVIQENVREPAGERSQQKSSEPGMLTLDAFSGGAAEEEAEGGADADDEEDGAKDVVGSNTADEGETAFEGGETGLKPVVHLTLQGTIGFNPMDFQKTDIERVVRRVTDPLHVLIKNSTYSHTVSPDIKPGRERDALEREVIIELIGQTREYKPVARELSELVIELKRELLHNEDVEGLVESLSRKHKEITQKTR